MHVSSFLISSFNATHLSLTEHLEAVLTDELQQLAVREAEELVFFGHLGQRDATVHNSVVR